MTLIKNTFKNILLILSVLALHSCTTSTPYEIKSPCVSIESDNPYFRSPCERRPANSNWELV